MKIKIVILGLFLIFGFSGLIAQGTNYYVDPGGNDGADGSSGTPWLTIQHAIDNVATGDIINVAAGTYTENLSIDKEINLIASGAHHSTIIGVANSIAISINADDVTIDGFFISHSTVDGVDDIAILVNTHNGATIQNNKFYYNSLGIELLDAGNNIIKNNIFDTNGAGIWLEGTTDGTNTDVGPNGPFYSLSLNNSITGNTITKAFKLGAEGGLGIYLDAACESNTFDDNSITENAAIGYYAWKASNNIITNNTITDNTEDGIQLMGSSGNTITGNTLSDNGTNGIWLRSGALSSSNNDISDNIISGNDYGIYLLDDESTNNYPGNVSGNTINANSITGNTTYGIAVEDIPAGTIVDANLNWWGDASGPYNALTNIDGTGNAVSEYVDYSPWLGEEPGGGTVTIYPNPADPASLGDAVNEASDGDIIVVNSGAASYSAITINKPITLVSPDQAHITNGSPAIHVTTNNVVIEGFVFDFGTADYAIEVDAGLTGVEVHYCSFLVDNGITTTANVDAEDNWWNDATGPYNAVSNPASTGAVVSNTVDYTPHWTGLTTPLDNAVAVSVDPTLAWGAITGAIDYYLEVNEASDFTGAVVYAASVGVATTENLAGLSNNTPYYWRVTATNATPASVQSSVFTFTTNLATPAVALPANNATDQDLNPTFTWTGGIAGANNYLLEVNTDGGFDAGTNIFTGLTGDVATFTLNSPDNPIEDTTKYYWRLTAQNTGTGNISLASTTRNFTTSRQGLTSGFDDGAAGVDISPILVWDAVNGSDQYYLEVNSDPGFGDPNSVFKDYVVGSTSQKLNDLDYNTLYYWRVTAQNTRSVVKKFKTQLAPITILSVPTAAVDQPVTNTIAFDYDHAGKSTAADIVIRYQTDTGSGYGAWTNLVNVTIAAGTGINQNYSENFTVTNNTNVHWEYSITNDEEGTDIQTNDGYFRTELAEPLLLTPVNFAQTTDRTPTLDWSLANNRNGVNYDVIHTREGVMVTVTDATSGNTTIYTFPAELQLGRYTWDIRAKDGTGIDFGAGTVYNTSKLASNAEFTLDIIPNLVAPINGLTGVSIEPYCEWYDGDVNDYIIEIDNNSDFSSVEVTKTVSGGDTTYQFLETDIGLPLKNSTLYYWRVKYNDGTRDYISVVWHFTTIPAVNVTADHPAKGSTVQTTDTDFTWHISQSQGGLTYIFQISQQIDEPTPAEWAALPVAQNYAVTETRTDYTMLQGTKYWWRVVVYTNGGTEVVDYMTPSYVFTDGGVTTPFPTFPTNGATIYSETPSLNWTIMADGTDLTYNVVVDLDGDSTTADEVFTANGVTATTVNVTAGNLYAGNEYYWYVKSVYMGTVIGSWCTPQHFTIAGGASINAIPSWPIGGATVYTVSPKLYWYCDAYASGVQYQVRWIEADTYTLDGDDAIVGGSNTALVSDMFTTINNLATGAKHWWQVRTFYDNHNAVATDDYGEWSTPVSFVTKGSGTPVVPYASYPAGGVTVYTTEPTLYWYLMDEGLGLAYNLEIREGTASTALTGTANYTGIADLYKEVSLTAGKSYVWAVQSTGTGGTSDWSTAATFKIAGGATTSYPVATYPIGNPKMYSVRPTLNWYLEGSPLAFDHYTVKYTRMDASGWTDNDWTNYDPTPGLEVNGEYDGDATIIYLNITSWKIDADLTFGKQYYWAVCMNDGTANSVWAKGSFQMVGGDNDLSVVLLNPTDGGTVVETSALMTWYANGNTGGVTEYKITYSRSDVFAIGNDSHGAVTATVSAGNNYEYTITNLVPGATYFWYVTPYWSATAGVNSVSEIFTFTVNTGSGPLQPIIGGPTKNLTLTTLNPVISWFVNAPADNKIKYQLEVSDVPFVLGSNNNSIVVDDIENPYHRIDVLQKNTKYYWRVRSKLADGTYSPYSSTGMFKTDTSAVVAVDDESMIPEKFAVSQNYPNPFNPTTTIKYSLPEASVVSIKIYNMLGQLISVLVNEERSAGTFHAVWKGTNDFGMRVASGVYIYRVKAGDNVAVKKMMLLK